MPKLKLPKKSFKGIKINCSKCKNDNPTCNHYDSLKYKVRVHVPGTKNKTKSKVLNSLVYEEAVKEAIDFRNELIANDYIQIDQIEEGNDYSIADAILKYNQYLSGQHEYAHKVKNVSNGHKDEAMRFCRYFCSTLKGIKDIEITRIIDVKQMDVARFYTWLNGYGERYFNKGFNHLKAFFNFLIEVEEIPMNNPFKVYVPKKVKKANIYTLEKEEFEAIISAIETCDPISIQGKERKNMYKSYLKDGFKLFLLTGGRREEVVNLKWKDIYITTKGIKFFKINNLKVERQTGEEFTKHIPINTDLFNVLLEFGYEEKKHTDEFILFPERINKSRPVKDKTMMDAMSKGFTHYKKAAKINKEVSLKNLRKTYITWVHAVMQKDTGILSSHSTEEILERHYIDPTILTKIEEGALKIKIFG